MTVSRFVTAPKSQNEAIDQVVDLANQANQCAYLARTAGAVTLTAAQMIGGIIKQGGTPGAFNMTTPTALEIIAALYNAQVGSVFEFIIINGGDNTITIVAGTDVTLVGTTAVPTSKTQLYRGVVTGATTVSLIGLLTAAI